jgi:hypothetical protein
MVAGEQCRHAPCQRDSAKFAYDYPLTLTSSTLSHKRLTAPPHLFKTGTQGSPKMNARICQLSILIRRSFLILVVASASIFSILELCPGTKLNVVEATNADSSKAGKRIPTNAITPRYTQMMAASDAALAARFGGRGAVAAANGFEPSQLSAQYPLYRGDLVADDGRILRGHLSLAMHLYGSNDGTRDTDVYVPAGFVSHSTTPTPTDAAVTFYYPQLGNFTDVTLAVFHVADFQISTEGTRVRIGNIGGRGGSIGIYRHSHLEFYRGNTGLPSSASRVRLRIDPATVFSMSTNMASRVRRVARITQ